MKIDETICPLCGNPNQCGAKAIRNGQTEEVCWCASEIFPKALMDRIPPDKKGNACVCRNCLQGFQQESGI